MEKEYLGRKTNSSTTKHSFGSGLLGNDDKIMRYVKHISCDRVMPNCKHKDNKNACLRCTRNFNSPSPRQDMYEPIIPGMKFL